MTDASLSAGLSSSAKRKSLMIMAAWAFVFFMATGPFYFQLKGLDPAGSQEQVGKPYGDYLRYFMTVIIAVYTVQRGALNAVFRTLTTAPFLMAFVALAVASSVWSEDPYLTLRSSGSVVCMVFGFAAALTLLSPTDSVRALLYGAMLCIFFSILWAVFLPHYGQHDVNDIFQASHVGKWRGVYAHKNHLGQVAGITVGALASAGGRLLPRNIRYLAIVAGVVCLGFAQSASGMLIAGIGFGFGYALFQLKGYPRVVALAIGIFVCVLLSDAGSDLLSAILVAMGKSPTFSGRTFLWDAAMQLIPERWLLGFGLSTVHDPSITSVFEKASGGEVQDAHNGYLELIIALGVLGLFLFLAAVVDAAVKGWNARLVGPAATARQSMTIVAVMVLFAALAEVSAMMPGDTSSAFLIFPIMWLSASPVVSGRERVRERALQDKDGSQLTVKKRGADKRKRGSIVSLD